MNRPLDCLIKSGNDGEWRTPPNPLFNKEGEVAQPQVAFE